MMQNSREKPGEWLNEEEHLETPKWDLLQSTTAEGYSKSKVLSKFGICLTGSRDHRGSQWRSAGHPFLALLPCP